MCTRTHTHTHAHTHTHTHTHAHRDTGTLYTHKYEPLGRHDNMDERRRRRFINMLNIRMSRTPMEGSSVSREVINLKDE